jgi:hypothetical protein
MFFAAIVNLLSTFKTAFKLHYNAGMINATSNVVYTKAVYTKVVHANAVHAKVVCTQL